MTRRGLWAAGVVLLLGVVAVLTVGTGFAKDENDGANKCSEATLHGKYLFAQDGVVIEGMTRSRSPSQAIRCITATVR